MTQRQASSPIQFPVSDRIYSANGNSHNSIIPQIANAKTQSVQTEQYSVTTELQRRQSNQPINCRLLKPFSINTAKTEPTRAAIYSQIQTLAPTDTDTCARIRIQMRTQIRRHSQRITNLERTINAITSAMWELGSSR